jgi:hypothetical protein
VRLVRYADEPELRAIRYEVLSQQIFPEYLQHNIPGNKYWGRLYEDFPASHGVGTECNSATSSSPSSKASWKSGLR